MDDVTNGYGDKLISLCRNVPLRICNGRKLGDTRGSFTCHKWNGQSLVDYCLASPEIYGSILFLKVGQILPLISDHCPISIAIKSQLFHRIRARENERYNFLPKPTKVRWDKDIAVKFENIIQSPDSKIFLQNFAVNGIFPDQTSIDQSTDFLTEFLTSRAEKASTSALPIGHKGGSKKKL